MSEVAALLLWINLAVTAAVLVVMALRGPVRRMFGPQIAYRLWLVVPAAAIAMLFPARVVPIQAPAQAPTVVDMSGGVAHVAAGVSQQWERAPVELTTVLAELGLAVWLAGMLLSLVLLAWRQERFAQAARRGSAGPAVVGFLKPRIVTPTDFAERYTTAEQTVVLAHEQTHISRHDSRINALAALARCVAWFNPFVHMAGHWLRIDQELACDAQVVAAHPKARRIYAEALLKTQLAARPLPIGCYWPGEAAHPLAQRIRLLGRPGPRGMVRTLGAGLVFALGVGCAWTAWAARPPVPVLAVAAAQAAPAAEPAPARAAAPVARPQPAAPAAEPGERTAPVEAPQPEAADRPLRFAIRRAPQVPPVPLGSLREGMYERHERFAELQERVAKLRERVMKREPSPPVLRRVTLTPPQSLYANTMNSVAEPGMAVKLDAVAELPGGGRISSNLTAFGSYPAYRLGAYRSTARGYEMWTRVEQAGDKVEVAVVLTQDGRPVGLGETVLASGETAALTLSNGQQVTLAPTVRPAQAWEAEHMSKAVSRLGRRDG